MSGGRLIVLSGPSGSGKSTVVARAVAAGDLPVHLAVSATTRSPRPGEVDGRNYHFWTPEEFDRGVAGQEFVEWAEVHGQRYGTLRSEVEPYLSQGQLVLLEIDVQGARQVQRQHPDCVLVFLRTSSFEEYEKRLRRRKTETEEMLERRLAAARLEVAAAAEYDYQILNDDLDEAVKTFRAILLRYGGNRRAG